MSAVATAIVGSAVIGGVMSSRSAKKSRRAQASAEARRMMLLEEQADKFQGFVDGLDEQETAFLADMALTYTELDLMIAEAKERQDQQSVQLFQAQRDLVDAHFNQELEAIDVNKEQMLDLIEDYSVEAVELVRADADANQKLKDQYKEQADTAVSNLRRAADISGRRLETIDRTGMTEEAAAQLSKTIQGVQDIKRRSRNLEAAVGKGGAASRLTAVDLESLKTIGESTAALRAEARGELVAAGQTQQALQQAAGERAGMLEETRGREELATLAPFRQAAIETEQQADDLGLQALSNRNIELRGLTGAEAESRLAREEEVGRTRQSLLLSEAGAKQTIKERTQDLTLKGFAQESGVVTSMADALGVQAQNFANMAEKSRAEAQKMFTTGSKALVGGLAGRAGAIKGVDKNDPNAFGQGAMKIGLGLDFSKKGK